MYPTQTNKLRRLIDDANGREPKPTLLEKRKREEHRYGWHPGEDDQDCPACRMCQMY